jgi:hypothetical protein
MTKEEDRAGDQISANVAGPVQGQVAVGKGIDQRQEVGTMAVEVSEAELAELRQAFADLKAEVASAAPPGTEGAAVERVEELEDAITAEKPDLTTMQYVKQWFAKNLPSVAGSVTGILVHPVVGKLVQAAGETIADQFGGGAESDA